MKTAIIGIKIPRNIANELIIMDTEVIISIFLFITPLEMSKATEVSTLNITISIRNRIMAVPPTDSMRSHTVSSMEIYPKSLGGLNKNTNPLIMHAKAVMKHIICLISFFLIPALKRKIVISPDSTTMIILSVVIRNLSAR